MYRSLSQIQAKLASRELTTVALVEQYLDRISTDTHNAFAAVFAESAKAAATALDNKTKAGRPMGKLAGAIITIKDNICFAGHPLQASSKILDGYVSPFSATVVDRLLAEDAIIIGSTAMDEFGMGSASTTAISGPIANAIVSDRVAGGSSGGAAVAAALDYCLISLGSDTGGSVRQPAAFNNLPAYKPAYGTLSRFGLIAYASSFDVIGFISKDLKTMEIAYNVASGIDPKDSTSIDPSDQSKGKEVSFAIIPEMFDKDDKYLALARKCVDDLSRQSGLTEVSFDYLEYLVSTYYILTTAEASSNLSRYDGVKYGHRASNSSDLSEMYTNTRTEGFGTEVQRRIISGMFVLSEGYFDSYYTKAQKIRRLIKDQIDQILDNHTFLVMPVTTSDPWASNEKPKDLTKVYLSDVFTILANLTGHQAISLPLQAQAGSPHMISLQVLTRSDNTDLLFAWANKL